MNRLLARLSGLGERRFLFVTTSIRRAVEPGATVVDDAGRDQYLLGAWRTAALRTALAAGDDAPRSLYRLLAPLRVDRLRPHVRPGTPRPWLDCDTPADLARARAVAAGLDG